MTERPGLGRVHDGFYTALFHGDEEQGVLLSDLLSAIRSADEGAGRKALYVTGEAPILTEMQHGMWCLMQSTHAPRNPI